MFKKIAFLILFLLANPVLGISIETEPAAAPAAPSTPAVEEKAEDEINAPTAQRNPFVPQLPIELLEEEVTPEEVTEPVEEEETPDTETTTTTMPTLPIIEKEKPIMGSPALVISGILWNSNRPQAIVNGNIVGIGDKMFSVPTDRGEVIEQIEFVSITREGVSVAFKNKTVVVNSGLEPPKGAGK